MTSGGPVALALGSAIAYGVSDFLAGISSRRLGAGIVSAGTQGLGSLLAVVAVIVDGGRGPTVTALAWGALSGLGSAAGTAALYRGLAAGSMSVVATLSGVLTAVIPVCVGIALGNALSVPAGLGIVIAIPAIGLVSWQSGAERARIGSGGGYGALAGVGFALLFIALDRSGTRSGAWPVLAGQIVSFVVLLPYALRRTAAVRAPLWPAGMVIIAAGVLSGGANLLFLAATRRGELAIVAVLTSLYPAGTVLMARVFLHERWTALQAAGLAIAPVAVVLVTLG